MTSDNQEAFLKYFDARDFNVVGEMLRQDPSLANIQGSHSNSPLHLASINNCMPLAKMLIEMGADVNSVNDAGATPLYFAAIFSYTDMMDFLLKSGADIHAKTRDGFTALHAVANNRKPECLRLLLSFHAKPDVQNNAGYTPLDYARAAKNTDNVKILEAALSKATHERHMQFLDKTMPRRRINRP